ncbi:hypothetical protein OA178_00850 [Candidatus Pelagibacter sp.]|nr:hypothetical protein [Candidatus Pelagibacter sp.]
MISFAKERFEWFNEIMKNLVSSKKKVKQIVNSETKILNKSKVTDVNILLNRVRLNKKTETRKKLYFSTATALGLVLFGIVIF